MKSLVFFTYDAIEKFHKNFGMYRMTKDKHTKTASITFYGGSVMSNQSQPNQDDRSNNVERLNSMIHNTIDQIHKSQETLKNASSEERQKIEEKNKRREQSIAAMKEEMQDEKEAREN